MQICMITYEMCLDVFIFKFVHRSLEFITATSSGLVELVFTYLIDKYTSGNELEPNMTTRAVV